MSKAPARMGPAETTWYSSARGANAAMDLWMIAGDCHGVPDVVGDSVAEDEHVEILSQGVSVWNRWRSGHDDVRPDLTEADLTNQQLWEADLSGADLTGASLKVANLGRANLAGATLVHADLEKAFLHQAGLERADLSWAYLKGATLSSARLIEAKAEHANFRKADLDYADLSGAKLCPADLTEATATDATFAEADLTGALLTEANLRGASLYNAILTEADLEGANLVETFVEGASLSRANVYGTAVWNLHGAPLDQLDLTITPYRESTLTVDNVRVAQFVYLLLKNAEIREVIDTLGKKAVLVLGRFSERKSVVAGLRERLRELGFAPIVFDFEQPSQRDLTETVSTLAGLSAFIIADLTAPRSIPQEAQAVIPAYSVPFVPIIQSGEPIYSMFQDLWSRHDWVMTPLEYTAIDELLPVLEREVVAPALKLAGQLADRKRSTMSVRSIGES